MISSVEPVVDCIGIYFNQETCTFIHTSKARTYEIRLYNRLLAKLDCPMSMGRDGRTHDYTVTVSGLFLILER